MQESPSPETALTRSLRVLHLEDSARDAAVLRNKLDIGGVSATQLPNDDERRVIGELEKDCRPE